MKNVKRNASKAKGVCAGGFEKKGFWGGEGDEEVKEKWKSGCMHQEMERGKMGGGAHTNHYLRGFAESRGENCGLTVWNVYIGGGEIKGMTRRWKIQLLEGVSGRANDKKRGGRWTILLRGKYLFNFKTNLMTFPRRGGQKKEPEKPITGENSSRGGSPEGLLDRGIFWGGKIKRKHTMVTKITKTQNLEREKRSKEEASLL